MPRIDIAGLNKIYRSKRGEVVALQNVDLSIRQNEFVTLVGPSGCGKSTLLKIIGALISPTNGTLRFDDTLITEPPRDVGFVFQEAALLPWRSVIKNILLPAEIIGMDMAAAKTRARELLELVGLAKFANHQPHELSGGMQQRVAICRGLIHNPSIVLMDEPFAALDAMTREELSFELLKIWSYTRKTIVFVTHSIPEAILLADRVVAMSPRPGRVSRIIDIDLPRPRTLETEFLPAFKAYSDEIRALIYQANERSAA